MIQLKGELRIEGLKWYVINIPSTRSAEFELEVRKTYKMDRLSFFKRIGKSGGYVGYYYAGDPQIPERFTK